MSKTSETETSVHWREATLILGGWAVITVIAGVITAVSNPCNVTMPWTRLVANQSAQFGVWALLTPGIFWLARLSVRPLRRFVRFQIGGLVGAIGVVTVLRPVIHNFALHPPGERHEIAAWMQAAFVQNGHLDGLVYLALFAVGVALTHYRRAQERGRRAVALEAELSKAQLDVLQTQVNPHFLFNALNTISSLAEDDPTTTRDVLARLSNLLRRSLDSTKGAEIALAEELAFVRQYLDIMQIRYGDRLRTEIDIPGALEDALVPAFCLQILVENAIKHGISKTAKSGAVTVRAHRTHEELIIEVIDNGPGCPASEDEAETGVGLANLRSRLHQLYGDWASVTLRNVPSEADGRPPRGARVTLRLPYIDSATDRDHRARVEFDGPLPSSSEFAVPERTDSR